MLGRHKRLTDVKTEKTGMSENNKHRSINYTEY